MCGSVIKKSVRGPIDLIKDPVGEFKKDVGIVRDAVGGALGIPKPQETPSVVASSPADDQAKVEQQAAIEAAREANATRTRRRRSSLLATGGMGDYSAVSVASPAASGKATLGQ